MCRLVCERNPGMLKAPVKTLGMAPAPCPTAKSLEDLYYPNLRRLTDDILRLALDGFEQGSLSESGLTAFDIAITQFHNAVADRRTFLADSLQSPARPRPVVA